MGQVDDDGKLNGLCRLVETKYGHILEGSFVDGQAQGYMRKISFGECHHQWSENGMDHGFSKKIDPYTGKTLSEEFYSQNDLVG